MCNLCVGAEEGPLILNATPRHSCRDSLCCQIAISLCPCSLEHHAVPGLLLGEQSGCPSAPALLQGQYSCSRPYLAACTSGWLAMLNEEPINCRSSSTSSRCPRHPVQPGETATSCPTSSGRGGRHSGCRAMTTSAIARGSGAPRGWRELRLRWCRGTRRMAGECGDEKWEPSADQLPRRKHFCHAHTTWLMLLCRASQHALDPWYAASLTEELP